MSQEIIDADDENRWACFNYVDDVWNSQKIEPDLNYPIILTVGSTWQNAYGDLMPSEREIRLTLEEARLLLFQLERDIASAEKYLT